MSAERVLRREEAEEIVSVFESKMVMMPCFCMMVSSSLLKEEEEEYSRLWPWSLLLTLLMLVMAIEGADVCNRKWYLLLAAYKSHKNLEQNAK